MHRKLYRFDAVGQDVGLNDGDFVSATVERVFLLSEENIYRRWCMWLSRGEELFEVVLESSAAADTIYFLLRPVELDGDCDAQVIICDFRFISGTFTMLSANGGASVRVSLHGPAHRCEVLCPFVPTNVSFGSESVFISSSSVDDRHMFRTSFYSANFAFRPAQLNDTLVTHSRFGVRVAELGTDGENLTLFSSEELSEHSSFDSLSDTIVSNRAFSSGAKFCTATSTLFAMSLVVVFVFASLLVLLFTTSH